MTADLLESSLFANCAIALSKPLLLSFTSPEPTVNLYQQN
jgi:hypothetical protein